MASSAIWNIIYVLSSFALVKILLAKIHSLRNVLRGLRDCPGQYFLFFTPHLPFQMALAPIFPPKGWFGHYWITFTFYAKHGSTCVSSVEVLTSRPVLWIAGSRAFQAISKDIDVSFKKDEYIFDPPVGNGVNIFGSHIVGSSGMEWKKHRRVANPAFNEANTALVWQETARLTREWGLSIDRQLADGTVDIDPFVDTRQLALLVLTAAFIGKYPEWDPSFHSSDLNDEIGLSRLFSICERYILPKVILPEWVYYLPIPGFSSVLKKTWASYDLAYRRILELILECSGGILAGNNNSASGALLRSLIKANMEWDSNEMEDIQRKKGLKGLTDNEVVADIFIFMFAGHETTASTLALAVVLLALYPKYQQRIFEEVSALSADELKTKSAMAKLTYTTAFIHETLRHFPPGSRLGRIALKDTEIVAERFAPSSSSNPDTPYEIESVRIPVKKDTVVILDIAALHMNPLHWGTDAMDFNPDKFIDTPTYKWPREAFTAFSAGPHNCIGQRFALTEAVCALACIVRDFEVFVPDDLVGKSLNEQRQVLLKWRPWIGNIPTNARVKFQRRKLSD